jgi:hypothetical protein
MNKGTKALLNNLKKNNQEGYQKIITNGWYSDNLKLTCCLHPDGLIGTYLFFKTNISDINKFQQFIANRPPIVALKNGLVISISIDNRNFVENVDFDLFYNWENHENRPFTEDELDMVRDIFKTIIHISGIAM